MWDTAGAPCVSGNDASAPKPCLNPGSSSDEDFTGSKTASFASVLVYNFFSFYIYVRVYLSIYLYIYIYTHTHTLKHIYIYIYIHTYTRVCVYIYIYIYTHTHTHTHTNITHIFTQPLHMTRMWHKVNF